MDHVTYYVRFYLIEIKYCFHFIMAPRNCIKPLYELS